MTLKHLGLLAAGVVALAGCSNQSSETDPIKARVQMKPTVLEKKVNNPKASTQAVDVYCFATDIACYLFKASYGRLVEPYLSINFHYQVSGSSGLGGRVYYVLEKKDRSLAQQWLKDLNTQNNGYSWANSSSQVAQWLESRKVNVTKFSEKLKEFENSKEFEQTAQQQKTMAVGAWPFFVRGSDSKLLSQITRQQLLEEASQPAL